jgi:hypothetical protein
MNAPDRNPRLAPLLRAVTFVEVIVLFGAGFGLFFLPDLARELWPWPPAPFNTRFLGAIYLASLVTVAMMLATSRWAPARIILPALLAFTAIVLAVSLLNLDYFDLTRWSNWIWFPLYVVLPINAAYHMWLYRRLPPADPVPTPATWRVYLLGVTIGVGLYGVGLLIAPEALAAFWPWQIDAFHGRMYSAAFITGAVLAWLISRAAAPVEFLTAALAEGVLSFFAIAGLLLVDAQVRRVDWSSPGTWLWVGAFAVMLVASIGMLLRVRGMREAL